jgi:hypothetical protein
VVSERDEIARAFLRRGIPVFLIAPGKKAPPLHTNGHHDATINEAVLTQWLTDNPTANIGVVPGRLADGRWLNGLDLDTKNGKNGIVALRNWCKAEGVNFDGLLKSTLVVRTPTGGLHVYLVSETPLKHGAGLLGKDKAERASSGVDVRSGGKGFTLAPGSYVDDKGVKGFYTIECDPDDFATLPAALLDAIGREESTEPIKEAEPIPGTNGDDAKARAREILKTHAPAIEGQGGNPWTYETACIVKDQGVDEADCLEVMAEWNATCSPPWGVAEIQKVIRNAYRYGRNRQGIAHPKNDFGPVTTEPEKADTGTNATVKKPRLYFELFDAIETAAEAPALVEGLLSPGAMSVTYGESNTGKTFFGVDITHHLATGRSWHGRKCEQVAGLYIAAEGGRGIRYRLMALRTYYGVSAPLALVPCPVDLSGRGIDVQPLLDIVAHAEQALNQRIGMIVIDTLARAINGANENASEDMGAFISNADRLRAATSAHLMIIHHTGKDRAKGARGHSSLRAATDTELEIADQTITITKQRDMDAGPPIGFRLHPVEIARDLAGKAITSCVLLPRSLTAERDFGTALRPDSVPGRALDTLERMTHGIGQVSIAVWREAFIQEHYHGERKLGRTAFDRALVKLHGHVVLEKGQAQCV